MSTVSTHRYTESPTEADGLGVLLHHLHALGGDATVDGSVDVSRVLQEGLRLAGLLFALTDKHA